MSSGAPGQAVVQGSAKIDGVEVPPMAIGTWSWGDSKWGYDREKDLPKIKEAWDANNRLGLTFYDTAEIYGEGESEKIIGELLKGSEKDVRDKVYIATKFLPFPRPANFFVFTPGVVAACKKSLARLGVDKIDLYQIHSATGPHSIELTCHQLAICVKEGLVKSVGVSNFNIDEMKRAIKTLAEYNIKLASNQVEFSLVRLLPETSGLLQFCKENDIAVLAYSPLAMGRLTGKYSSANPPPSGRRFGGHYTWEQLDPLIDQMRTLSQKYEVSISAIALNWVICKGAIPLGGARDAKQAGENAQATTFRLSDEEVRILDGKGLEGKTDMFWQHA